MYKISHFCYLSKDISNFSIDWTLFWTFISTLLVAVGVILGLWQLREIKKSSILQAYAKIAELLQNQDIREARGNLLDERKRANLTPESFKTNVEKVSQSYDMIAKLLRRSGLGFSMLAEDWQRSIRLCWGICKDTIIEYRITRGIDFWSDFEKLNNAAEEYYHKHPELHPPT